MHHQSEDSFNDPEGVSANPPNKTRQMESQEYAGELRDALMTGVITGNILTPMTHIELLKSTVKTATQIVNAEYGTLFRFDAQTRELVFEASVGGAAKDLKQFRMPANQGIAGHVAQTRKALLTNDAQNNEYWNFKVGLQVMFAPRNILFIPLLWGEKLIWVLQVCDKADGKMFTEADSKILQLFANQAAMNVGLSRSHQSVISLVAEMLETCSGISREQKDGLRQQAFNLTQFSRDDPEDGKLINLARLIQTKVSSKRKLSFAQKILWASRIFWQLVKD
jgi:transcriptional regulator with GAF, ATPase, and Fis domain